MSLARHGGLKGSVSAQFPTAHAVGYDLPPLRGSPQPFTRGQVQSLARHGLENESGAKLMEQRGLISYPL